MAPSEKYLLRPFGPARPQLTTLVVADHDDGLVAEKERMCQGVPSSPELDAGATTADDAVLDANGVALALHVGGDRAFRSGFEIDDVVALVSPHSFGVDEGRFLNGLLHVTSYRRVRLTVCDRFLS